MIRKSKLLTLAVAAVAAVGTAAASAQAFEMHVTTSNSASIFAEQASQQFVLTTNSGTIKCTTATFEGTAQGQAEVQQITNSESTLTPTLAGCQALGQAGAIDMNGCKFTLTGTGAPALTASIDVTGCTAGKKIEATTSICRLTVPEQNNISHVVFANTSGNTPHDVLAQVTLTGITYQADGPLCPAMPTGQTLANGTTAGQAKIVTRVDTGTEQATLHNHEFQKLKQNGAPVGILAT